MRLGVPKAALGPIAAHYETPVELLLTGLGPSLDQSAVNVTCPSMGRLVTNLCPLLTP